MRSLFNKLFIISLLLSPIKAEPAVLSRIMTLNQTIDPQAPQTPLGSLWKLFIYAYQIENQKSEAPYTCRGQNSEEIFCCAVNESIERNIALARSCTPFFDPKRLAIQSEEWNKFWKAQIAQTPHWLSNLSELKPETRVNVDELLHVLVEIRQKFKAFDQIESATVGTVLFGTASNALSSWGSTLRVKTFTWRDEEMRSSQNQMKDALGFVGGFAGWLPDGSTIWVSGPGHGRDHFHKELKALVNQHLESHETKCVRVRYFAKYPIKSMTPAIDQLVGPIQIHFENGKDLKFVGDGSLSVQHQGQKLSVVAEMTPTEYISRVIDREIESTPVDAARAFSIVIRTFLEQNSKIVRNCQEIADSSHLQRVSPSAASPSARKIAQWSEKLVLQNIKNIRYHSTQNNLNRMSWAKAKSLAIENYTAPEILKTFYPSGVLTFSQDSKPVECLPNLKVARWIDEQSKLWLKSLNQEPGFEKPNHLKVCQTLQNSARPIFANLEGQEIYVPQINRQEDALSVLHEYLHIGFRSHPLALNEKYIEKMAHKLLEER